MRELTISANEGGQRIDKYLSKRFRAMPFSLLYKYLRKERVKLNGKKAQPGDFVREGDVLSLYIPEEFFAAEDARAEAEAETRRKAEAQSGAEARRGAEAEAQSGAEAEARFTIVYEDGNILVADKEAGLLCHPDRSGADGGTLIDRVKALLAERGEYAPGGAFAPALCNRLDRNTTGLVIAAKTGQALRDMNARLRERLVERRYLAAVHGEPAAASGVLRGFLCKNGAENRVYLSRERRGAGEKEAVTKYRVLERRGGVSLLEVELVTGRTHQIRAQLASIGCPLLNDRKYGGVSVRGGGGFVRGGGVSVRGGGGFVREKKGRGREYCPQSLCAYKVLFLPAGSDSLSYLDGRAFYSAPPDFLKQFCFRYM